MRITELLYGLREQNELTNPDVYLYRGIGQPAKPGQRIGAWWSTDPYHAMRYAGQSGEMYHAKVPQSQLQNLAQTDDFSYDHPNHIFQNADPPGLRRVTPTEIAQLRSHQTFSQSPVGGGQLAKSPNDPIGTGRQVFANPANPTTATALTGTATADQPGLIGRGLNAVGRTLAPVARVASRVAAPVAGLVNAGSDYIQNHDLIRAGLVGAGTAGGAALLGAGGAALGTLTSPVTGPVGPIVGGASGGALGATKGGEFGGRVADLIGHSAAPNTPAAAPAAAKTQPPVSPPVSPPATQPNLVAGGAIDKAIAGANPSETTNESLRAELDDLRRLAGIRQKLA